MFHRGAAIEGDHPRLVGGGTVRYMYFDNAAEVSAAKDDLRAVIQAWYQQQG